MPITGLDKVFMGASVIDGASKAVKGFKGADNKYDNILGNNTAKVKNINGEMNAVNSSNPMFRSASEEIETLFKEAAVKEQLAKGVNAVKGQAGKAWSAIQKADAEAFDNLEVAKNLRNKFEQTGNKAYLGLAHQAEKDATKFLVPAAGVGVAGTAGVVKGIKMIDKKFGKKNESSDPIKSTGDSAYPYVAGAGLLGAATFDALAHKSVTAPLTHMKEGVIKGMYAYPKKLVGRAGKAGKMTVDVLKAVKDKVKTAEIIDDLYFEKIAGSDEILKGKAFAKKLVKEDFFKEGLKAIPYVAGPAAASYVIGRDLRHGGGKIRDTYNGNNIVIDVPLNKANSFSPTEKIAMTKEWEKFIKNDLPSKGVQGLARALFPATIVAGTGRNITNAMEDIRNKENNLPPLEEGKARVIIQTKEHKNAFETIDDLFNEKVAKSNVSSDPEKDAESTVNSVTGVKKKDGKQPSIHLAHGIRKRQKMLE
jgi:hypothetical protein